MILKSTLTTTPLTQSLGPDPSQVAHFSKQDSVAAGWLAFLWAVATIFILIDEASKCTLGLQKWEVNSLVKLGNSLDNSHPQGNSYLPLQAIFAKVHLPNMTFSEVFATPFMLATSLWFTLSV